MAIDPQDKIREIEKKLASRQAELEAKTKVAKPIVERVTEQELNRRAEKERDPNAPVKPGFFKEDRFKREILNLTLGDFENSGPVRLIVNQKGGPNKMAKKVFDAYVFQKTTAIPIPPGILFPLIATAHRNPMKIGRQVRADGSIIDPQKPKTWPIEAQVRGFDHQGDPCDHYEDPCPPAAQYVTGILRDTSSGWVLHMAKEPDRAEA